MIRKDNGHVVLFQPSPFGGLYQYRVAQLPLGLLYCATALEHTGYRVTIIDQSVEPHWKQRLYSVFADKPLCFGVTCMTGPQIRHALAVCNLVRDKYPHIPIIWGGVHASLLPEQTLENSLVDIVVVGEGEDTLPELIEAIRTNSPLKQVKGIAFKQDGQYIFTGLRPYVDLDAQPPPALHLVDVNRYREHMLGIDHVHVHCSRGCTFECAFCWDPIFHKRQFRKIDPSRVLETMQRIVREYEIKGFLFQDDNFFLDLAWARDVLERIVRSDLGISIGKLFIRADTLCKMDMDFLNLLVRAGVKRLVMGVESGSQRLLDLLKKRITLDQVMEANRKLIPYPIKPAYMFMMGLPTETSEELTQSIHFADRLIKENPKATRTFNIYTPYPGTELFKIIVDHGLKEPKALLDWAGLNYHGFFKGSPWILPETKPMVEVMNFALMCSKHDNAFGGFKRQDAGSILFTKLYSPLARYRVRNMDVRFPFEVKLIRAVRFCLGRD
jgi:radical SAM superfamily enzyme YgiQ (UPF0313 family)